MKPDKKEVGQRIKVIREKLGYSMDEFGKLISDSPRSSVNSWEKGVSIPKRDKLEKIAVLGNTTPDKILYGGFQNYVHDLLDTSLNIRLPEQQEAGIVEILESEDLNLGDDVAILKAVNHLIENIEPASEDDFLEYKLASEFGDVYIAYGNHGEEAKAFVYADRENEVFHFSPFTFSNMSLSRFLVFLANKELYHYILTGLRNFDMVDSPKIVIYDIEKVENNIRAIYLKYDPNLDTYVNETESEEIEEYGTYEPFVHELLKEKMYREVKR
jgi:transcriptional regulator with XRE-family HTH domain